MLNNQDPSRFNIPSNITREHIIKAINEIDINGYSEKNASRKYDVLHNEKRYPPKVVISIANKYANGPILEFSEFSGGEQFTNKFLKERGFEITLKDDPNIDFEYESHSWKILSDTTALKRMDKSSFKHHGTGIPVDIRPFFFLDTMKVGERREISLSYGVLNYSAHFDMLNEKNPRTRLLWRSDLQSFIQNTFPMWSEYFDTHTKHNDTTPILKIIKTKSQGNYRIFFEETKRSSETLKIMNVYSREELKAQFGITDATINNGIFKPKDISSVWLFITERKTPDRTQYRDSFDGQVLQFEGQTKGRTDNLIINHEIEGNEILIFYRKEKHQYPKYGFQYLGRFYYYSHKSRKFQDEPTRFILYPLDITSDDDKGELIPVEPTSIPMTEGKERTRIQTFYERNPRLRAAAIKIHGTKCIVCGFDFGEKYGSLGEGYIEIHHLIPHASIKKEREVDPKNDLAPVCSNCHRMIHKSTGGWLTLEEMKKLIK